MQIVAKNWQKYNVADLPQHDCAFAADQDSQSLVSRVAWSTWMLKASPYKPLDWYEGLALSPVW
jgi:hypothetical protein